MKTKTHFIRLIQLLILIFLYCCATPHQKPICIHNGKEFGTVRGNFREKFWSYYERGLSYAEGKCFEAALADFDSAIQIREKDQRQARTYGVQFIDYFPHREKGKIYFETGKLKTAKEELELSVSQYPSAKARFYLDQTRKALIEQQRKEIHAPRLNLEIKSEIRTRDDAVVISGKAEDENYVSAMQINSIPYLMQGSEKHIQFKQAVHLSEGKNHIQIEAENLFGKKTVKYVEIYLDRQGPMITIDNLDSDDKQIIISGFLHDDAGISELLINNQQIPIQKDSDSDFMAQFPKNTDKLELAARDSLGNENKMQVDLSSTASSSMPVLYAGLNSDAGDAANTAKPEIRLKNSLTDGQTVYMKEIYIQAVVEAKDNKKIKSLKINEKPVGGKRGKAISFGEMILLKPGENKIIIEVEDSAGIKEKKEIRLIGEILDVMKFENRLSISISPHESNEDVINGNRTFNEFKSCLEKAFLDNARFQVNDNKYDMKLIIRVCESLDLELVGEMREKDGDLLFKDIDVYHPDQNKQILTELAKGMANIFVRKYPLLDGKVIDEKGSQIVTDIGEEKAENYGGKGAKIPNKFIVYDDNNIILGNAHLLGFVKDKSTAELIKDSHDIIIKPDDHKVITR